MRPFKVALVGLLGEVVPSWVPQTFQSKAIDFIQHECFTASDLALHASGAHLVWVWGSWVVTADRLDSLSQCGAIVRSGSGTDNVPVEEATRRNIVVANTPQALTEDVSDHVLALLLGIVRQIAADDSLMRRGIWESSRDRTRRRLRGCTMGLLGFGNVARVVARKVSAFGVRVIAHDPFVEDSAIASLAVQPVTFDELLRVSDFLSVHIPLTPENRHRIGEHELRSMKPTAIVINTSRGAILDQQALVRGLREGWIGAAGLDVFEQEPIDPGDPLLQLDNVLLTPHVAAYSDVFLDSFWRYSVETVIALADGKWPRSVVNRKNIRPRWPLRDVDWVGEPCFTVSSDT